MTIHTRISPHYTLQAGGSYYPHYKNHRHPSTKPQISQLYTLAHFEAVLISYSGGWHECQPNWANEVSHIATIIMKIEMYNNKVISYIYCIGCITSSYIIIAI